MSLQTFYAMPRFLFTCLVSLLLPLAGVRAESVAQRAQFGVTPLPVWSELTWFEQNTLSHLHAARNAQPDALLALYMIASGVRQSGPFVQAKSRIADELPAIRQVLGPTDDPKMIGATLNREMHARFFVTGDTSAKPPGYAADQSSLRGIFDRGEFNCISSAMLYAVLARHFGLDVQGVLLPSHAFIQLNTDEGGIDVETTSAHGFGERHDRDFFARQSTEWHSARGLVPATYEDYLRRRRVSPLRLAAINMLNQHIAELPFADGARLAEISAFLYPEDALAQEKRLRFYNRELRDLAAAEAWRTLERMFEVTYAVVAKDAAALAEPQALTEPLLYYRLGALLTHAENAQVAKALDVLEDLTRAPPPIAGKKASIEAEIAHSAQVLAERLAAKGAYQEALEVVPAFAQQLPEGPDLQPIRRWVYARWVQDLWASEAWQDAVSVAIDWWEDPDLSGDTKAMEVLAMAQHNLVLKALNGGEMATAKAHVELCEVSLPAQACASARHLLQSQAEAAPSRTRI